MTFLSTICLTHNPGMTIIILLYMIAGWNKTSQTLLKTWKDFEFGTKVFIGETSQNFGPDALTLK